MGCFVLVGLLHPADTSQDTEMERDIKGIPSNSESFGSGGSRARVIQVEMEFHLYSYAAETGDCAGDIKTCLTTVFLPF